jgi:hypothetical protein
MSLIHKDSHHVTPLPTFVFWEEAKVNWQIQTLVNLGKMRPSFLKYACKVILIVKKDDNMKFIGDYHLLTMHTRRDAYFVPLIDDVLNQMGYVEWFFALNL